MTEEKRTRAIARMEPHEAGRIDPSRAQGESESAIQSDMGSPGQHSNDPPESEEATQQGECHSPGKTMQRVIETNCLLADVSRGPLISHPHEQSEGRRDSEPNQVPATARVQGRRDREAQQRQPD
jgi:hypothetical protein